MISEMIEVDVYDDGTPGRDDRGWISLFIRPNDIEYVLKRKEKGEVRTKSGASFNISRMATDVLVKELIERSVGILNAD